MWRKITWIGFIVAAILVLGACGNGQETQQPDPQAGDNTTSIEETGTQEGTEVSRENDDTSGESLTGTYPDGSTPVYSGEKLKLIVDGEEIIIAMYDNTAVDAFLERLPLENLSFFDLSGIEKPIQQLDEPFSLGEEEPGYAPAAGEMVIYRQWGNFTIFYGDFRHSDELVPLGKVESGLEILTGKEEDFVGTLERME